MCDACGTGYSSNTDAANCEMSHLRLGDLKVVQTSTINALYGRYPELLSVIIDGDSADPVLYVRRECVDGVNFKNEVFDETKTGI